MPTEPGSVPVTFTTAPHPDPVELDDHQRVRRTQNPALVQFIYSADAAASFCRSARLRLSFCAPSRNCDLMLMS